MKLRDRALIGYKVFFALLGFSAIVTEIAVLAERERFDAVNFFSFFTIETNSLVVVTLLLSAFAVTTKTPQRIATLRAATTVYILVVGIGFSLLLAGLENVSLTAVAWDNTVLHYIIPAAMVIDFLIDRPVRTKTFMVSLRWLLFPIAYVAYSLVRGAMTGWYPYPFLNPETNGAGAVAMTISGLTILSFILVVVVYKLSYPRGK